MLPELPEDVLFLILGLCERGAFPAVAVAAQ
jgi:hypothetical protein